MSDDFDCSPSLEHIREIIEYVPNPARTCLCPRFGMAHRPDQCVDVYESIQWGVWRDNLHEDHGGEG